MNYNTLCAFCEKEISSKLQSSLGILNCEHSVCGPCLEVYQKAEELPICLNNSNDFPVNDDLIKGSSLNEKQAPCIESQENIKESLVHNSVQRYLGIRYSDIHNPEVKNTKYEDTLIEITPFAELSRKISMLNSVDPKKASNSGVDPEKIKESIVEELCSIHKKKLKAVCLESKCKTRVCSSCGLYGGHRVFL
jgi:hypothetical protein